MHSPLSSTYLCGDSKLCDCSLVRYAYTICPAGVLSAKYHSTPIQQNTRSPSVIMAENTPLPLYTPHDGDTLYTIPDQPSFAEPPPPPPPRPPAPFRRRARTQGQGALQLVTPTQLKGHLALLHAFHALKVSVQDGKDIRFPAAARKLDERRRWAWFVALAVERYVYISVSPYRLDLD